MEENRVSAFRIRGLAAIMGFSNDRNPPVASTPPADRGRSPGSPEPSPRAGGTGPPGPKPGGNRTQRPAGHLQELLHVAPVFLLQQPGEEREERQEQDHPDAKALALERGRFAGVLQDSGNVADGLVELRLALRARPFDLEALDGPLAAGRAVLAVAGCLAPPHYPQKVGPQ